MSKFALVAFSANDKEEEEDKDGGDGLEVLSLS